MALLQIAEPGQLPLPHQARRAVGIDLGTTNSLVATVRGGRPEVLPDERGGVMLPSVVNYSDPKQVVVGEAAQALAALHPADTLVSIKRFMGRGRADAQEDAQRSHYRLAEGEEGMVRFITGAGEISPVQASAQVLGVLRERALAVLGDDIDGAVITVPAYFDEAQRQATKDAATLAGLPVLRLLNEPTAAAVAYGLDSAEQGVIAVYDLGGGTFDISILRLHCGVFEVLATGGDTALGGDDFDAAIADWLLQQAGSPYAYHTIGSAFACRAEAYIAAGGMNRRHAAEDFYFLQQLAKCMQDENIDVTALLVQGPIISTILKESDRLEIDLLILGCHKHGRLYGVLMDDTEEGLLSKCSRPIMFVPD